MEEDELTGDSIAKSPNQDYAAIARTARTIVEQVLAEHGGIKDQAILQIATPDRAAQLRLAAIPNLPRDMEQVVAEAIGAVFPYRVRMNHPRFFGFIPSPASPLSWLGDMLTAGFNPHAGSWMQSSGPSAIEDALISWFAERAGLPASAGGLFVSGGSMANLTALTVARDRMLDPYHRAQGVAYVSAQTHSSVAKGLKIIGFLDEQIRRIPADTDFRMDLSALEQAIAADRNAGLRPFAIVASCGTTNTGSIDPLDAIADLARREALWMHVDGAYGASAALSKSRRALVAGLGRADSISWDAHKWLFQTYGCGFVLLRDKDHLAESFAATPEYLRDAVSADDMPNFWDFGAELTRPARAIKLWLTLQILGTEAIGEMIDHGFVLAETVERELRRLPDWEIVSPASMAIVTFRYAPSGFDEAGLDELNEAIARALITANVAAALTTKLAGKTVMRICSISPETSIADMEEVVAALQSTAIRLASDRRS